MTPMRFTLKQIMIASGILGVLLGFALRSPGVFKPFLFLILPAILLAAVYFTIRFVARLPLRFRLAIEFATLFSFLALSTMIWGGSFTYQEERCRDLARRASEAAVDSPTMRLALDREAAWFSRKAWELRRRGLWQGLAMGPSTRDYLKMARMNEVYELGVLESIDKHEKALGKLLSSSASAPRMARPAIGRTGH